jgi:hypothetical protein
VAPGLDGDLCELNHPTEVFERSNGKLVIVCWHNHKLREWDPGPQSPGAHGARPGCSGDGLNITSPNALLNQAPHAVEALMGPSTSTISAIQCIRKIDPAGVVSTVVSTPQCNTNPGGFGGDNGPPGAAQLSQPTGPNPNPPGGGVTLDAQQRSILPTRSTIGSVASISVST